MLTLRKIVGEGKMAVITTVAEPLVLDVLKSFDIDYWNLFVDESYVICHENIFEEENEDGEVPRRVYRVDVRSTANLQLIRSIWIALSLNLLDPREFCISEEYSNGLLIFEWLEWNGDSNADEDFSYQ